MNISFYIFINMYKLFFAASALAFTIAITNQITRPPKQKTDCKDLKKQLMECYLTSEMANKCNKKNTLFFVNDIHDYVDQNIYQVSDECSRNGKDICKSVRDFYVNYCPELNKIYKTECVIEN